MDRVVQDGRYVHGWEHPSLQPFKLFEDSGENRLIYLIFGIRSAVYNSNIVNKNIIRMIN